jgi:hypothetical protein
MCSNLVGVKQTFPLPPNGTTNGGHVGPTPRRLMEELHDTLEATGERGAGWRRPMHTFLVRKLLEGADGVFFQAPMSGWAEIRWETVPFPARLQEGVPLRQPSRGVPAPPVRRRASGVGDVGPTCIGAELLVLVRRGTRGGLGVGTKAL